MKKRIKKIILKVIDWKCSIYCVLKYTRYFLLYIWNVEIVKMMFIGLSNMFSMDYNAYFNGDDDVTVIMGVINIIGIVVMIWFAFRLLYELFVKKEEKPFSYYLNGMLSELVRVPMVVIPFLGLCFYWLKLKNGVWIFDFYLTAEMWILLIIIVILKFVIKRIYKEEHFTKIVDRKAVSTKEFKPYARED